MATTKRFYGLKSPGRSSPAGKQLLQELEALNETLYPPRNRNNKDSNNKNRRASASRIIHEDEEYQEKPATAATASYSLGTISSGKPKRHSIAHPPRRDSSPDIRSGGSRSRHGRQSLSPLRRRKDGWEDGKAAEEEDEDEEETMEGLKLSRTLEECADRNRSFWKWKPFRAISHIGMQRFSCVFSVYVDCVRGLSRSMNGIRLCVALRKKETREGAVQTLPARVFQGLAEFEETLQIRCHVYSSKNHGFQSRPFTVTIFAVDAEGLEFGKYHVDLSVLLHKNIDGEQKDGWNAIFDPWGKARGSQLVLGLGYDILDKNASACYPSGSLSSRFKESFPVRDRRISKSLPGSARGTPQGGFSKYTPSQAQLAQLDSFYLDQPLPPRPHPEHNKEIPRETEPDEQQPQSLSQQQDSVVDVVDDFVVEEKGVEIHNPEPQMEKEMSNSKPEVEESKVEDVNGGDEENAEGEEVSGGGEVVKEVIEVLKQRRLSDLESLARQIEELESSIVKNSSKADDSSARNPIPQEEETELEKKKAKGGSMDMDEIDKVTGEFLQMLELEDDEQGGVDLEKLLDEAESEIEKGFPIPETMAKICKPDSTIAKQSIVGTRDGGLLLQIRGKQLCLHMSEPMLIPNTTGDTLYQLTQKMAAMGAAALMSGATELTHMEDLTGKTLQQITLEGATSALAKRLRRAATAPPHAHMQMSHEAIPCHDVPLVAATSLALECMALQGLLIMCDMPTQAAPYVVPSQAAPARDFFAGAVALDLWKSTCASGNVVVGVQLRDPDRDYEALGWPMIGLLQCEARSDAEAHEEEDDEDEHMMRVMGFHLCGVRYESAKAMAAKQKQLATQWLLRHSLAPPSPAASGGGGVRAKRGTDMVWRLTLSVSSAGEEGTLLFSVRNADVAALKP